jgi:hypothetical protein
LIVFLIGAGAGAGVFFAVQDSSPAGKSDRARVVTDREVDTRLADQDELIAELRARIRELEELLAAGQPEEPNPFPDDSVEKVEVLLQDAYAENNVDWLIEVIERLLMLGEEGYPALRRLIMDIAFKAKFRPAGSDFRFDQIYTMGRVFTKHEKKFIGFLDFLLTDPQTNNLVRQFTVPIAAFYVGAKAPGSEKLQQSLLQMLMSQGGAGLPESFLLGGFGKRMNIFAMAMSGDPKMIAPLRDELKSTKDKKLQGQIIGALAYLGDEKALPLIKDRLDPNSKDDFREEVRALARLGSEDAHSTASEFVRAIPDSKRFYRHAAVYVRAGGGAAGVLLIKERVQANPNDPEVSRAIGTLQRFPTKESHETLVLISQTSTDEKIAKRATDAATKVDNRLKGVLPDFAK